MTIPKYSGFGFMVAIALFGATASAFGQTASVVMKNTEGKEVGSVKVPKTSGYSWAHPVVVGGRLHLREGDMLYCYDVRAER